MLSCDQVGEAIVIAREDASGQNVLCAYFTAKTMLDPSVLSKRLAQELPAYMIPSHFIQIDELPLTPNGKVDRRALPVPEEGLRLHGSSGRVQSWKRSWQASGRMCLALKTLARPIRSLNWADIPCARLYSSASCTGNWMLFCRSGTYSAVLQLSKCLLSLKVCSRSTSMP